MKSFLLSFFIILFINIDLAAQTKFYWCNSSIGENNVQKADSTGENITNFLAYPIRPENMAIDTLNQQLYWVDYTIPSIVRSDFNGENIEHISTDFPLIPAIKSTLAVDAANDRLYFSIGTEVISANLDGSDASILFTDVNLSNFHLDITSQTIFYQTHDPMIGTSSIFNRAINSNTIDTLMMDLSFVTALTFSEDYIYWSDYVGGTQKSHLDSTTIHNIAPVIADQLIIDASNEKIYLMENSNSNLIQMNLDGTDSQIITTFYNSGFAPPSIALDYSANNLYFTTGSKQTRLGAINLDDNEIQSIITQPIGLVAAILTDPKNEVIFVLDQSEGTIFKTNMEGEILDELYSDPTKLILSRSYDPVSEKIVWVEADFTTIPPSIKIKTINADGTDLMDLPIPVISPNSIAIDVERDLVFWTDFGMSGAGIFQAKLDGSELSEIDLQGQIFPIDLEINYETGELFITFNGTNSIAKYHPDTEEMTVLVENQIFPNHINIDPLANKLYWTGTSELMQSNLDGENIEAVFSIPSPINHAEIVRTVIIDNVNESFAKNIEVEIFPNPATDYLNIQFNNQNLENIFPTTIQIIDYTGKMYKTKSVNNSSIKLDIQDLPKGAYFIQFQSPKGLFAKPLQILGTVD